MAVTTLRPSIDIKNQFKTIRSGFESATKTAVGVKQILFKKTKVKREAIINDQKLFNKRQENIKRKDKEEALEVGKIGNPARPVVSIIQDTGKGFLERIMDAIGSFVVGWLVYNLPNIITMAENLISRVKIAGKILGDFVKNIGKIFTGSARVFGAILTNIVTLDIFDTSNRVENSFNDLYNTFGDLQKGIEDGIGLVTTPLGQLPGEVSAEFGDDQTVPGEQVAAGERTGTVYTGPGGPETSGGTVSPQAVYSYLRSKGIPHIHAMGILANIKGESGFRIGAQEEGDSQSGVGLFQYSNVRKPDFLRAVPDYKKNWKGQIDYAINEDRAPQYLKTQFSSPEEAAYWWMDKWERPAARVYTGRNKKHNDFIKSFNPGGQETRVSSAQATPITPSAPSINPRQSYSKGQNVKGQIATKGVEYTQITSLRGSRGGGWHGGVDIAAPTGTYIALRADCEVVAAGRYGNYGLVIDVWVPQYGIQLRFAHNSSLLIRSGKISAGTSFARVGSTGRSTGPHIHLEASTKKGSANYGGNVDPSRFVPLILLTSGSNKGAVTAPQIAPPAPQLPPAQIAAPAGQGQQVSTSPRRGPQIAIVNDIPQQQMQIPQTQSTPSQMMASDVDEKSVLNSLIKNHLLLDLSYT
jgi:murein DD-endopeptidase MepM/ murein hydrolase activator NlpD